MDWDQVFTPDDDACQRCGHPRAAEIEAPDGKRHPDDACACGCTSPFHSSRPPRHT